MEPTLEPLMHKNCQTGPRDWMGKVRNREGSGIGREKEDAGGAEMGGIKASLLPPGVLV